MKKNLYLYLPFIVVILSCFSAQSQTISSTSYGYDTSLCGTTEMDVSVAGCTGGLTLKVWYGDGTSSISSVSCSGSTGNASFMHTYATSGTYTIKKVLYSGSTSLDSNLESYNVHYCCNMPIAGYIDANYDCVFDASENLILSSGKLQVDSAGIPIDTISMYSGAHYTATGPAGTIYSFRVIQPPGGFIAACPVPTIIYDTIPSSITSSFNLPTKYFGYQCSSTSGFNLSISGSFRPALVGTAANAGMIWLQNSSCTGTAATVKFEFSPKYTFGFIAPATSYTVSGTSVTFDAGIVNALDRKHFMVKLNPVAPLIIGDTVNVKFTVYPIIGDSYPANNMVVKTGTVVASWDPNHKSVTPSGYITGGTELEYMLEFENDGTDFAHNVHIMDTLSNYLDIYTLKGGVSSHNVNLIQLNNGSNNILKFDFPNIMLPDTTHHPVEQCRGMVTFSIKAKSPLAYGTTIANRVGIYFDTNPAVMTNTVYSTVPFPTGIPENRLMQVELYPNPVNNLLTIKTDGAAFKSATVYNITGQVIGTHAIGKAEISIPTEGLAPGIYYVVLKGDAGTKAVKFEKL